MISKENQQIKVWQHKSKIRENLKNSLFNKIAKKLPSEEHENTLNFYPQNQDLKDIPQIQQNQQNITEIPKIQIDTNEQVENQNSQSLLLSPQQARINNIVEDFYEKYILEKILGQGCHGLVKLCRHKKKIKHTQQKQQETVIQKQFQQQQDLLKQLNSQTIIVQQNLMNYLQIKKRKIYFMQWNIVIINLYKKQLKNKKEELQLNISRKQYYIIYQAQQLIYTTKVYAIEIQNLIIYQQMTNFRMLKFWISKLVRNSNLINILTNNQHSLLIKKCGLVLALYITKLLKYLLLEDILKQQIYGLWEQLLFNFLQVNYLFLLNMQVILLNQQFKANQTRRK
ncbi:hypothetical protein IMG5_196100 [Ichthyophthirius multifiliis]|uniref:Protein kinase domain protein n=1 Tax=Ichthyophthirius multifiliis TaxID=5932 RepID=G0R526_ICHMU|nr:hypothetical protein IMG5_196100 [Ichthyophthirius multifiliis]EGR27428.1 hypothetical protein IMG5_196100 [Ichthyophthirius multifiliis]|eukprot:XP_004024338.1 hypothetical protein IMG5_196100 [Ichthyophthirius multifiliis]